MPEYPVHQIGREIQVFKSESNFWSPATITFTSSSLKVEFRFIGFSDIKVRGFKISRLLAARLGQSTLV